jgi:queuine tRNA-ribosyltransferase
MPFSFTVTHASSDSKARCGVIETPHGNLETPNFIFCATKAAIKGASMEVMRRAGADIILSNTYHLMLQPGAERVAKMGGLQAFTGWNGPMLTDSGGYQVFSMAWGGIADEVKGSSGVKRPNTVLKIDEYGVLFQSYLDGKKILLTPESAMQMQYDLGADLVMAFDECTAFHHDHAYTKASIARTHRWLERSIAELGRLQGASAAPEQLRVSAERMAQNTAQAPRPIIKQALYGIIQGAHYRDLREAAARHVSEQPTFGLAVGGSFGQSKQSLYDILEWVSPYLRRTDQPDRPVHLLGIGDIADIFAGVRRGIDTFDCVQPTRLARHGWALMPDEEGGRINFRNARFRDDPAPLDPAAHHAPTAGYSRAYLHHLIKAGEMLGVQILVEHNVSVMTRLLREVRAAIRGGTLDEAEAHWCRHLHEDEATKEFGDPRLKTGSADGGAT